jgi:hypothetical protein
MATLDAVREPRIPSLAVVRPDLPIEVCELVHQALHVDREARPAGARAMYESLQRIMRLYNMAVTPFDLADTMQELFPESGGGQRAPRQRVEATEVGRRADEDRDLLDRTLGYLRQRHPDASGAWAPADSPTAAASETALRPAPRRSRWPWVALAGVLGAGLVGGALALSGGSPAPRDVRPVAGALASARRDAARVPGAPSATGPDRAPDAGRQAPARLATLVVRSTPAGAQVTVDGRRHPRPTPASIRLAPGRYSVAVSLRGHRTWRGSARLTAGGRALLDPPLEPLPAAVTVRSNLPCRVQINRQPAGETPVSGRPVTPGPLTVTCIDAARGIRETRRLKARPGDVLKVNLRFGVLAIGLTPWARVRVDGRERGTTPLRLHLPEGEHRVRLSNPDERLERSLTVEIRADQVRRISNW